MIFLIVMTDKMLHDKRHKMSYRVREPILTVRDDPPRQFTFVTLETGSLISVNGEPQRSGLVEVHCDGKTSAAFMRDILLKCERIQSTGE